jgi:hypothetical protein
VLLQVRRRRCKQGSGWGGEAVGDYDKRKADDRLHLDNGCNRNFAHHRGCSSKPVLRRLGSMADVCTAVLCGLIGTDSSNLSDAGAVACPW